MTEWNEAEKLLKGAGKDYLLAYNGTLVGPKEMYMARYRGMKEMALLLHATTESRIDELAREVREEVQNRL